MIEMIIPSKDHFNGLSKPDVAYVSVPWFLSKFFLAGAISQNKIFESIKPLIIDMGANANIIRKLSSKLVALSSPFQNSEN